MPLVKTCFLKCPLECGVKVFGFPDAVSQKERRKKWFEILQINWETPKYIYLCARHFSSKHFTPLNFLKITAVPDINLEMREIVEMESPCAIADPIEVEAPSSHPTIVRRRLYSVLKDPIEVEAPSSHPTIVRPRLYSVLKDPIEVEAPSSHPTIVRPRLYSVLKDPDKIKPKQKTIIAYKIVKLQKPVVLQSSVTTKLFSEQKGPTKPATGDTDTLCPPALVKPLELDDPKIIEKISQPQSYVNSASKNAHLMLKNGKPYTHKVSKEPPDPKPYKYTGKFAILKPPVEDVREINEIPKTRPETLKITPKLKKIAAPAISEIVESPDPPVEVKNNTQKALDYLESMMVISTAVQTDPSLSDHSPRKKKLQDALDGLKINLAKGEQRLNELNKQKQEARKTIAEADKRIADVICAKLSKNLAKRVQRSLKNNFQ